MLKTSQPLWHTPPSEQVLQQLGTAPGGLSAAEAAQRLDIHGLNQLRPPQPRGPLLRFLLQFHNVLIYVLLSAAATTAVLGHPVDTAVIIGVVVINAIVGFIQEGKAESALAAIRKMLSLKAMVLRDGQRHEIAAETLVPGDWVFLQSGDKVPADLRLIEIKNLRIQEAVLTGEAEAVEKSLTTVAAEAAIGDRSTMAYSGTLVSYGQGLGVVVATGETTEIGRISTLLQQVEAIETPLLRQMGQFGRWLSMAIVGVAAATFLAGVFWRGQPAEDMFMAAVALAVAAIPEGLPAIMTIILAIGVQRMARRNAIIRQLPAVETLGAVTVICSDKTGTLTRNEMTVQRVITPQRAFTVSGVGYAPVGGFTVDDAALASESATDLQVIARAALTGPELETLDDAALQAIVQDIDVYARASPEHKLRLVAALQARHQVVAMTGDGVNDAPALKRADVGVAMGMKGTEAAKEASDMVLADDNFASIAHAVEEGRTVYDNLLKALMFILPTNGAQALAIIAAILLDLTLPITPVQILWVNLVTAITLALALAFEPAEANVMLRPPRNASEPLLSGFILWRIALMSVLLVIAPLVLFHRGIAQGMALEEARTVAVNALVIGEIFYLLNSRYLYDSVLSWQGLFGNRYVLITIGLMLLLQWIFTYFPPMEQLMGTAPISAGSWLIVVLAGIAVLLLVELEKAVWRRWRQRNQ